MLFLFSAGSAAASCGHLLFTLTRLRIASQLCDLYLHLTKSQSLSSTTIFQAALSPFWSLNPKLRIVSRTAPNATDDPGGWLNQVPAKAQMATSPSPPTA